MDFDFPSVRILEQITNSSILVGLGLRLLFGRFICTAASDNADRGVGVIRLLVAACCNGMRQDSHLRLVSLQGKGWLRSHGAQDSSDDSFKLAHV
jgi:hypothetical protein